MNGKTISETRTFSRDDMRAEILNPFVHKLELDNTFEKIREDLRRAPMTGWRRSLKPLICFIGKMSYLAGGMAISIRGRQASRKEAPILVVAPHSSFLDSCIVYATKMSSVIVRKESMDNYVGSR
ncbi:unnamed protein product [Leptidea sinapis]|uniref:Phospholipid/glycerol acyltransferase domain-containing protein n=1 Tax=Leptidea sinapis TaxID=189913 RepID=A0A5E4QMV3_9NEOP|nr:unnamed protein product [Leptidea sinapis]